MRTNGFCEFVELASGLSFAKKIQATEGDKMLQGKKMLLEEKYSKLPCQGGCQQIL